MRHAAPLVLIALTAGLSNAGHALTSFTLGDVVVSVEGNGLSATTRPSGETFTQLAAAPADSTFKGVAFAPAPVPEPRVYALMMLGLGLMGAAMRKSRRRLAA